MEGKILLIFSLLKSYTFTDAAFTYTPLETGFCESTDANFTWVFDNAGAQSAVEWTVNDTILIARLFGGSTFIVGAGYSGKLQNDGNGGLIIKGVTPADSGKYKCAVSYNDGTPQATSEQTVTIYRTINTKLDILEEKKDSEEAKLTSTIVDSSITYTWNSVYSTNFPTESYITVTRNGEYRLCISGGKAKCLNQTLSNCANHTVFGLEEQINSACGSFHCGFWLLWLVIVTSIIILFLMWKKVKRFGFSASGCSNMKIGITVVFSVVAIGTGLGLGLGLREGQANCLECGATIGISIALGVALSVIEFIVIIKCDKEKVSVFRAVINITSESYTDDLKDCTSRAYKDLSRRVTKAIESLYKNVPGQQTVVDLKFSPGLKVTFDLISQEFDDCSELSDTLNNALQSGLISPFKVSSVGFEFMPLQDWKDSKRETSDRSNGDRARSPASASAIKVEAE